MTEEEFRAYLRREMENPETRRLILELVTKELRRVAAATYGGTAPLHFALNNMG